MDAYTSRKFWGSLAIVCFGLFLSMAIATFSFEFTYAADIAAAEEGNFITASSPVGDCAPSDPLTTNDHAVLTARSATLTASFDDQDLFQQDAVIVSALPLEVETAAAISDTPLSHNNITLDMNTCAILIQ